jgi:hypothetical protein
MRLLIGKSGKEILIDAPKDVTRCIFEGRIIKSTKELT